MQRKSHLRTVPMHLHVSPLEFEVLDVTVTCFYLSWRSLSTDLHQCIVSKLTAIKSTPQTAEYFCSPFENLQRIMTCISFSTKMSINPMKIHCDWVEPPPFHSCRRHLHTLWLSLGIITFSRCTWTSFYLNQKSFLQTFLNFPGTCLPNSGGLMANLATYCTKGGIVHNLSALIVQQ